MAQGEKIIGIDLGTTNSVVAIMEGATQGDSEPRRQPADAQRGRVYRQGSGWWASAKRQAITNPRVPSSRSSDSWAAATSEVAEEEKLVPYNIVGGPNDLVKVQDRRQGIHAAGNLGEDPAEAQADGRGLPGR